MALYPAGMSEEFGPGGAPSSLGVPGPLWGEFFILSPIDSPEKIMRINVHRLWGMNNCCIHMYSMNENE